ncbi:MAG TPA: GNAT family N-acetyltransferase [Alphaproteobacteria bacterium]|nr:GNAT family N-acetyltransferase [Alphaproteobacteria bacterium]
MIYQNLTVEFISGAVALQRACFPEPFPEELLWQRVHLANHLRLFPRGQFVALDGDKVIASCTNMLVSDADWDAHLPWEEQTGGLMLTQHNPDGKTLYGIDISVHPDYRGRGIARRLYQKRYDLVRAQKLTRYGTVCRMPDYAASGMHSPAEFADAVVAGVVTDRTLTPLLKMGLAYQGIIADYMDDAESGDAGAILNWQN